MASHQQQTTNPLTSPVDHHHIVGIATQIRERTAIRPKIGIICGSGLGGLAEQLDTDKPSDEIPYEEIGFPKCSGTHACSTAFMIYVYILYIKLCSSIVCA